MLLGRPLGHWQALLMSPKERNASRDGFVNLNISLNSIASFRSLAPVGLALLVCFSLIKRSLSIITTWNQQYIQYMQAASYRAAIMRSSLLVQFEHSAIRCGEIVTYHKRNGITSRLVVTARTLCAPLMTPQRQKRQPFGDYVCIYIKSRSHCASGALRNGVFGCRSTTH